MVSPHPHLHNKFKNTKQLIKENKSHLIPEFSKKYSDNYISQETFNKLEKIKPWIEQSKSLKHTSPHKNRPQSLQPIQDNIIVLCIDFIDKPAQIPISTIYNRFFSPTNKSLKNYYNENSYNQYSPNGEAHGWYRAPQSYSYYVDNNFALGTYPNNMQKLVEDTINIAINDNAINWNLFDNNSNNIIDYLAIVHSGGESAYTGNGTDIWAHAWSITPTTKRGYYFEYYMTTSEFMQYPTDTQRTGIDSHEFGHLQGLPDLYDYSANSAGVGMYSIMSYGSWCDNGITPSHLDAWSKYRLGYTNTFVNQINQLDLYYSELLNVNYIFTTQNTNEYFIIENRQKVGYDTYLPSSGILIWKVNENVPSNNNELCYLVGLIQADGRKDLENNINNGDDGDAFPGSTNNRNFNNSTIPNNVLCDGTYPIFKISNISDSSNIMSLIASYECTSPQCNLLVI